ncbi:MAG: NAD-dependent epimerase/dehydratase family protein [Rhodothermales bacterium]
MILITGASGQIGVDLADELVTRHGPDAVLVTDLRVPEKLRPNRVYDVLDVTYMESVEKIIQQHSIHTIYHLAGILSATGERHPELAWNVNVNGVRNVLEAARRFGCRVFWPSSIAVFGPTTPKVNTPQATVTEPGTMYGATKVTGELLCKFHATHHDLDVRSVRFPGIISHAAPPGGGTTDWAVDMFFQAVRKGHYTCFVTEETRLPMMYMPDAVKSVLDLMDADDDSITVRTSYNLTAFSFSAGELATAIQAHIPDFTVDYEPDFRQEIADSWPQSINDGRARHDWGWQPEYDLNAMVKDMLHYVRVRVKKEAAEAALDSGSDD